LSDLTVLAFCAPFIVMALIFFFVSLFKRDIRRPGLQIFLFFALLFWLGCELTYLLLPHISMAGRELFFRHTFAVLFFCKIFLQDLLAVALFLNMLSFYRFDRDIGTWFYPVLFSVPAVSLLTVPLAKGFSWVVKVGDVAKGQQPQAEPAFWYYMMNLYVYLLYGAMLLVIFASFRTLPKGYRSGFLFHLVGWGTLLVSLICAVVSDTPLVHRCIGAVLCAVAIYLANQVNKSGRLQISEGEIFNYLDQAIFILDETGRVVDVNDPGRDWLKSLGRQVEYNSFDGLMATLFNNKWITRRDIEGQPGFDVYFTKTGYPLIYQIERQKFETAKSVEPYEFVKVTDVTRNRLLIERLRDMAGVDALTGLANRWRYQDLLRTLDKPESYPFCVILGDANGLKTINDTLGHNVGDEFLKVIGGVLKQHCPDRGYAARCGGDEFVFLLPTCTERDAQDYIYNVYQTLKTVTSLPVAPSISLGFAIKYHANENLNELIAQADKKMYDEKVFLKSQQKQQNQLTVDN